MLSTKPLNNRLKRSLDGINISGSFRMGARVVDWARLESVCTARYRGFESLPIRQLTNALLPSNLRIYLRDACRYHDGTDSAHARRPPTAILSVASGTRDIKLASKSLDALSISTSMSDLPVAGRCQPSWNVSAAVSQLPIQSPIVGQIKLDQPPKSV
jgi:hypothetical protein